MEGFHYLMKIGRFLNVLAHNSELLAKEVEKRGIQGFVEYFRLCCTGSVLAKKNIKMATAKRCQWRIMPVAI